MNSIKLLYRAIVGQRAKFIAIWCLGLTLSVGCRAQAKPLKVFILAGQSNMQGHLNVSTFDSMADDPKTAVILKKMRNVDGNSAVCEKVWISSAGCAGNGWPDVVEQTGKLHSDHQDLLGW